MGKHKRDRDRSPKHKKKKHSSRRGSSPDSEDSSEKSKMSFEEELEKLKEERRFEGLILISFK